MTAIFKKEVKGYLTSMTGYIFIFIVLVLEGIYFTAYNIQSAYPVFSSTLSAITFIFLILIPILTMKSIAEERKQKTDQLLLTSPTSLSKIVLGKYFALLVIYLIPMAIISFYPLIMGKYGTVSYAMAYLGIFGFLLLGFAQISIGLFLSSITENPVIAAVITFIILFVSYMMSGVASLISDTSLTSLVIYMVLVFLIAALINNAIKNILIAGAIGIIGEAALIVTYIIKSTLFESSIQNFLSLFNLTSHFSDFSYGILNIQNVVYFLSVIVLFLFLTVQTMKKRRWN